VGEDQEQSCFFKQGQAFLKRIKIISNDNQKNISDCSNAHHFSMGKYKQTAKGNSPIFLSAD
jgi:hypothetical protein